MVINLSIISAAKIWCDVPLPADSHCSDVACSFPVAMTCNCCCDMQLLLWHATVVVTCNWVKWKNIHPPCMYISLIPYIQGMWYHAWLCNYKCYWKFVTAYWTSNLYIEHVIVIYNTPKLSFSKVTGKSNVYFGPSNRIYNVLITIFSTILY